MDQRPGSGWSPCANVPNCWAGALNSCSPRAGERWCACAFHARERRPMPNKVSVLLVDDHSLVLRVFRRMLEDEPDMNVVGEASDGAEAIKLAKELKPKVIVM